MITWIITIGSLIGTWLNAKKKRFCFIIWIVCNIAWMIYDITYITYSRAVLDIVQTAFSVYGFIEWGKE